MRLFQWFTKFHDDSNYYKSELEKINVDKIFLPNFQFSYKDGKTHWMQLNATCIKILIKWLKLVSKTIN